jgi:6,7-dimethyl-8-ribityllumazine synthase
VVGYASIICLNKKDRWMTDKKTNLTTAEFQKIIENSRVAFIQAGWHSDIVEQGQRAFIQTFTEGGGKSEHIDVFDVPGSYEIPLQAKTLAELGNYDAIVAAGLVVDGGIYRHDFVANAVISGLMNVQLETNVPVLTMVLTPLNFHEIPDHIEFFTSHFLKKGAEAARACIHTLQNRAELKVKQNGSD